MNKSVFLKDTNEFIDYFSEFILGKSFNPKHKYKILDPKLPEGYKEMYCKDDELEINDLEDAFKKYWWDNNDYNQNKEKLDQLERSIKTFHAKQDKDPNKCFELVKEVFIWGGVWNVNKRKVKEIPEKDLLNQIENGIKVMNSEEPNLDIFNKKSTRMNAGYTKYYSLACREVIIYDGRVGAALGLMVRKFCEENNKHEVPNKLKFRWGPARGNKIIRDPSLRNYQFIEFRGNDLKHAESNIKANWIIVEALRRAKNKKNIITWEGKEIDIRMIEAALFTIGYSLN